MARSEKSGKSRKSRSSQNAVSRLLQRAKFLALRALMFVVALVLILVVLFSFVNPPTTITMLREGWRLDRPVRQDWVRLENIAPVMRRSAVAAEDANFCLHWGFDVTAIRAAIEDGGRRGGSTISQQVVKNVFLWQGRSWFRKALEATITPVVELVWSKRRILEVYLNLAEMGEGDFGVKAAAQASFGVQPEKLSARQSALLAAVLPSPKKRSASKPSARLRKKAAKIADGAATIRADGRAACFED